MATESPNEFFTQAAWAAMWNPESDYYLPNVIKNGINQDGVKVDPMGNLTISQVPPSGSIQLMKSDDLASWLPIKTGYVGIQFTNVLGTNLAGIANGGLTYTDVSDSQGNISAVINLPNIMIAGTYTLVATGLAQCALDTAAILPSFSRAQRLDANGDPLDPEAYLNAARDQRTRLWQTNNGGVMIDNFYDHNEAYNYAFQNNNALQYSWTLPENQHYMNTTYNASQSPSTAEVNTPPSFANELGDSTSYNENAFYQQIAVWGASIYFVNNPPAGSNITTAQFQAAADSAADFVDTVGITGNTDSVTVPMTVDNVYTTIANATPKQVALTRAKKRRPRTEGEFIDGLTDKQRAYLIKIGMIDNNFKFFGGSDDPSATLMTGSFMVTIGGGSLTLGAGLTFTTSPTLKATANVTSFTSSLRINSVNIVNQPSWLGLKSIGQAVIDAYNNSGQIASLMQDKSNDALGDDTVKNYISGWLNTTLQKLLGDF